MNLQYLPKDLEKLHCKIAAALDFRKEECYGEKIKKKIGREWNRNKYLYFSVPAVLNLLYSISLWSNEWAFDGVSGL